MSSRALTERFHTPKEFHLVLWCTISGGGLDTKIDALLQKNNAMISWYLIVSIHFMSDSCRMRRTSTPARLMTFRCACHVLTSMPVRVWPFSAVEASRNLRIFTILMVVLQLSKLEAPTVSLKHIWRDFTNQLSNLYSSQRRIILRHQ